MTRERKGDEEQRMEASVNEDIIHSRTLTPPNMLRSFLELFKSVSKQWVVIQKQFSTHGINSKYFP